MIKRRRFLILLWFFRWLWIVKGENKVYYIPDYSDMNQYFRVDLDELMPAEFFSVSSPFGYLSQPIDILPNTTFSDFNGGIQVFHMAGGFQPNHQVNGKGWLLDRKGVIYKSELVTKYAEIVPIPSFIPVSSLPQPESHQKDFKCTDIMGTNIILAIACQYLDTKTNSYQISLTTFLKEKLFSQKGQVTFPYFGQNSPQPVKLHHASDNDLMAQTILAVVPSSYVILYLVADPEHPEVANIIDSTIAGESFSPISIQSKENRIIVLSKNDSHSNVTVLTIQPNFQATLEFSLVLSEDSSVQSGFQIVESFAFFVSNQSIIRIHLLNQEKTVFALTHPDDFTPKGICGSSSFINVFWVSIDRFELMIQSYSVQEYTNSLELYSKKLIYSGKHLSLSWFYDSYFDVIHLAVNGVYTMARVGRPFYFLDKKETANITITAHNGLVTKSKQLELELVNENTDFSVKLPPGLDSCLPSGGFFSFNLNYNSILFGVGIHYRIEPQPPANSSKWAFPLSKVFTVQEIDQITYNTRLHFLEKNQDSSESLSTDSVQQWVFLNYQTTSLIKSTWIHLIKACNLSGCGLMVFGCENGGSISSSLICSMKDTFAGLNFEQIMLVHNGFLIEKSEAIEVYEFFNSTPKMKSEFQKPELVWGPTCQVVLGRTLVCISPTNHLIAYTIEMEKGVIELASNLSKTVTGEEMTVYSMRKSESLPGVIGMVANGFVYLYNYTDPANPVYISTVDLLFEDNLAITMISRDFVVVHDETVFHIYKVYYKRHLAVSSFFFYQKDFSFDTGTELLPLNILASEQTNTVYLFDSSPKFQNENIAIRLGEGMSSANNPIFIGSFIFYGGSVINYYGNDYLIGPIPSLFSNYIVFGQPVLSIYPLIPSNTLEHFQVSGKLEIENHKGKKLFEAFNISLYNSFVNVSVSPDALQKSSLKAKSSEVFNIKQSGVIGNAAVLFYYATAPDMDDIQTRIIVKNSIEKMESFSLITALKEAPSIVDIKHNGNSSKVMMQGEKSFFMVGSENLKINTCVEITPPGVNHSLPSFYCIAGAYNEDITVSLCECPDDNLWVFFYSFETGPAVFIGSAKLEQSIGVDVSLFEELLVVQDLQVAYFYWVDYEEGGIKLTLVFKGNSVQAVEAQKDNDKTFFLLISATGAISQAYYDQELKEISLFESEKTFFEALSLKGYSYFRNSAPTVTGHNCEINYTSSAQEIHAFCTVMASNGIAQVSFGISSLSHEYNASFFGMYMPFGAYSGFYSTWTMGHLVVLASKESPLFGVGPETQESSSHYVVLVYKKIKIDSPIAPLNFSMDSANILIGGIPGPAFFTDDQFVPELVSMDFVKEGNQEKEMFILTSNQFEKVLCFNITGESLLVFNQTEGTISDEFTLIGFNGIQEVSLTFKLNKRSSLVLMVLGGLAGLVILLFLVLVVIYFIFRIIKSREKPKSSTSSDGSMGRALLV